MIEKIGCATLALVVSIISVETVCARPRLVPRTRAACQTEFICPMHRAVKSDKPGKCSRCGMNLKEQEPAAPTPSTEPAESREGESAGRIFRIPDTTVYDQDGKKLRFYTDLVKGKTVAINFIFTTCTTICPPLTATFRKVQQELGDRVGRDVMLISISVDPATDVPERLKSFSAKFNAGPGWSFITGGKPEIDDLLRTLEVFVADKNEHTPMLLIGNDSAGYWTRTYGLAKASTIADAVRDAAARKGSGVR
ncbi:MAG TPA: SCO family protein [Blastocatellia bacterium]|nr:SCO family protein [Blastocatellia bacterium]